MKLDLDNKQKYYAVFCSKETKSKLLDTFDIILAVAENRVKFITTDKLTDSSKAYFSYRCKECNSLQFNILPEKSSYHSIKCSYFKYPCSFYEKDIDLLLNAPRRVFNFDYKYWSGLQKIQTK